MTHFKCTYITYVNLPRADNCLTWKLVFSKSLVLEDGAKQCMTWRWLVFPSSRVSRALSFILVSDCLYLRFNYTSLLKVFGCGGARYSVTWRWSVLPSSSERLAAAASKTGLTVLLWWAWLLTRYQQFLHLPLPSLILNQSLIMEQCCQVLILSWQ